MNDVGERRDRLRTVTRWTLTVVLIALAIAEGGPDEDRPVPEASDDATTSTLKITSISDANVSPGDAIIVSFSGATDTPPLEARLAKRPTEIVVREPGSAVIRVPSDLPYGKAALRLHQGSQKSKAWDVQVRASNYRKLLGRLIGGLALFVFGLGMLALGVRGLAGRRVRTLLGKLTERPVRAVGVGVLVGGLTQLTSSAAAFTVSLVEARLLAVASAVPIFVGAQLGASITGALLPVGLTRESLLVIAIGVLWSRLATDRRATAIAKIVLGAGLMLYGLHLLQTGVEPLVSSPRVLPYLGYLRGDGFDAQLACAASGALLAIVLQGPGPVYVLVIGLAQTTGALPLANALAILAGTNLGAALGMAMVAWQSERGAHPLARPQVLFGATATIAALAMLPVWTAIATAVVGGAAGTSASGHHVVEAHIAWRLAIGFAGSQLVVTAAWLAALPALARRTRRPGAASGAPADPAAIADIVVDARRELAKILERQRFAADVAFETSCAGDRTRAVESEAALGEARRLLEARLATLGRSEVAAAAEPLMPTAVATLQLQRVVEQLVAVAELGVERGLRLSTDEQARLRGMAELARESFDAAITAIDHSVPADLEAAGAREIRMNQLEAEGRTVTTRARRATNDSAAIRVSIAELIDSYEHVGNHLYRLAKTLADYAEDL